MKKIIVRYLNQIRGEQLRRRAANIRLDLMLHVDHELARERALLARAARHDRLAATLAPKPTKHAGLAALIPGAKDRLAPCRIINLPRLVRKEAA